MTILTPPDREHAFAEIEPKPDAVAHQPPERFFWAVIDGLGWSRAGELPAGLLVALAEELPIPVETVHAVATPIDDMPGRLLVCAVPRSSLAELPASAATFVPNSIPAALGVAGDPASLNLLVGSFEPAAKRGARRAKHHRAAAVMLVCTLLASIGLFRRAAHAQSQSASVAKAGDVILASLTSDRREDSLTTQVRMAEALAAAARREKPPMDAAGALESFLAAWPTSVPSKPQAVSISTEGLSCAVVVEGDPAPLVKAIRPPSGYTLTEPRIAGAGSLTRVNLQMRPEKGGSR